MLSAKRFLQILTCLSALFSLYFSLSAGRRCLVYHALKSQAPARVSQWEILEEGDRFALQAVYSYEIEGKIWRGVHLFEESGYLNEFAAHAALKGMAKQPWRAWYDPSRPSASALEKKFPLGAMVRAALSLAALLCTFYLKRRFRDTP